MRSARPLLTALATAAALVLAACGGSSSSGSSSSSSSSSGTSSNAAAQNQCTKDKLKTRTPGTLTVATDKPAFPPYFEDNDPKNGKGFESAVAYAIAKRLGYAPSEVKWTTEPFNASYAPGPKKFDFDINQISITPARQKQVDFSTPYFTAPQALVALKSSAAAKAASLGDVQNAKLGVQIGTTSLDAVQQVIKPSSQPKVFNDSNDVVTALKQKQVDAVVVDLPTAFFLTAAQVPSAKIVGQFSAPGGDQWGALLQKGSPLTKCVSQAIGDLREGGQLQALEQRWMGAAAGAPVLKYRARDRGRARRPAGRPGGGRAPPRAARPGDRRRLDGRRRRRARRGDPLEPRLGQRPRHVLRPRGVHDRVPGRPRRLQARRRAVRARRDRGADPRARRRARPHHERARAVPGPRAARRLRRRPGWRAGDPRRLPRRLRHPGARAQRPADRPAPARRRRPRAELHGLRGGGLPRGHRLGAPEPAPGGARGRADRRAGAAVRRAAASGAARARPAAQRLHLAAEGRRARGDPRPPGGVPRRADQRVVDVQLHAAARRRAPVSGGDDPARPAAGPHAAAVAVAMSAAV